ncbi:MAG: hypothetical protein J3K34DRAFT_421825 [Monoraphidium minutum]|nr:MAG: hypothetical protein J3K34DRAFT_421825 [Monoraphidium minutum]
MRHASARASAPSAPCRGGAPQLARLRARSFCGACRVNGSVSWLAPAAPCSASEDISCTAVLVLSLLTGVWISDSSGAVAALGLMAVYIGSTECLVLFYAVAPLSALIDLFRLGGPKDLHGRGWLILFQLLAIAAKAAAALFAWSLHKSAMAGEGDGSYGLGGAPGGGLPQQQPPPPPPSGYARVDDPFASAPAGAYTLGQHQPQLPTSSAAPAPQRAPQPQHPQPQQQPQQQQQPQAPAASPPPPELL